MLYSAEIIGVVGEKWQEYRWCNVVIEGVMVGKGGGAVVEEEGVEGVVREVLGYGVMRRGNIGEGEVLTGMSITNVRAREEVAKQMVE
ncbi:bifunctional hydroxymethylpyrimidine kinase/phosphomethylpyrimidine kinase, partial [Paenibacillus xylanexedens]|uniref:bifunctional hydroxymethylpyrimidine kinase/phosphomethylpyrimidine kinase n=1 Tax=Paenibacillus xylanexedens TaxID=528191 RepID=UPI003F7B2AA2